MLFKASKPEQRDENPYGRMDEVDINDSDNLFNHGDHEYSTLNSSAQDNNVIDYQAICRSYLDQKYFPNNQQKPNISEVDTGKMVSPMNQPPSPFSSSSSNRIDIQAHDDQQDSTMTSKKMAVICLESQAEDFEQSYSGPSNNSLTSRIKRGENQIKLGKKIGKQIPKKKKDERKNVSNNCFKFIVKEFLSEKYSEAVEELSFKYGIMSKTVRSYYKDKLSWNVSLSKLRDLVNFKQANIDDQLRRVKQTFHSFFVFYLKHRYNHHILTEKKIEHKHEYLEAKRYLMYLPDIRPSPKFQKYLSQN